MSEQEFTRQSPDEMRDAAIARRTALKPPSAPANFSVPVPEAGPNAIATLSMADLKKLREKYSDQYAAKILRAFDLGDVEVIEYVASIAIAGGSPAVAMQVLSVQDLTARLADALMLRLKGKTVAELEAAANVGA